MWLQRVNENESKGSYTQIITVCLFSVVVFFILTNDVLYSISYYIFTMATEMAQIMVIHLNLIKLSCSAIVLFYK